MRRRRPHRDRDAGAAARRILSALGRVGAGLGVSILVLSCSPDLHGVTGPITPFPNVEGILVRGGTPLVNHRVRLVDTATDKTVAKQHTDRSGHYGFAYVGAGDWTVKVTSEIPDDPARFSGATCNFIFSTPDSSVVLPTIDLDAGGASMVAPPSGAAVVPPSFFEPLTFEWTANAGTAFGQVRVYDAADSTIWVSGKTNGASLRWNGLRNRGAGSGQPVPPGEYRWRLRLQTGNAATPIEYTTAPRGIAIQAAP